MGLEGKNFIFLNVLYLMPVGQNANNQLGLTANITEAANFAIYFTRSPAALSTPHLYISSLATWVTDSTLSQLWKNQFPHIPAFSHLKARDVPLMVINTASTVEAVAISSDGTCIVSGSKNNCVQVWDASNGDQLKMLNGHTQSVTSVAFSSDCTCIVSGSKDHSVQI